VAGDNDVAFVKFEAHDAGDVVLRFCDERCSASRSGENQKPF